MPALDFIHVYKLIESKLGFFGVSFFIQQIWLDLQYNPFKSNIAGQGGYMFKQTNKQTHIDTHVIRGLNIQTSTSTVLYVKFPSLFLDSQHSSQHSSI